MLVCSQKKQKKYAEIEKKFKYLTFFFSDFLKNNFPIRYYKKGVKMYNFFFCNNITSLLVCLRGHNIVIVEST